ncbi:hypothetical protein D777_01718 [Marinobacter nitratireducens]|uniref:PhoD-like phosphatase metallophosphatase domain-containing protein n=1 Tax=Marinobacter nitratireducens TaxID=1137280 RepID=A0A072N106_9GAMM|nr:alkaline phosphatase D family protein [Marinobacter nitratireducens]KEF31369.1 hypothetical protein D777_01718 [Marinobacter nitratireducens]
MMICGPVVRHANRSELNVWFVLDRPASALELNVFADDQKQQTLSTHSEATKVIAGERCVFCLLRAALDLGDGHGEVFYEITVDGEPFGDRQLLDSLCLSGQALPGVYLPRIHQHFLQASCRKPHASHQTSRPDQMARALEQLQQNLGTVARPSQMFLTGDQIYADDVSPLLLDYLHRLRDRLGLQDDLEHIPAGKDLFRLGKLDAREWVTRAGLGFTSSAKSSHLLSLSEYLCMYLFAFAGVAPDDGSDFASHDALKPRLATHPRNTRDGKAPPVQYKYDLTAYEEDLSNLQAFATSARHEVRKLFANISVYMIFDDHEVTDDWNLSKAHNRRLTTTDLGRYTQRNALVSYFLCQHWGNRPDGAERELNDLQAFLTDSRDYSLDTWLFTKYWGYELEQTPPVAVLDTRTHRAFSKRGKHSLGLMSDPEIEALGNRLAALPENRTLILVSPTPMYGFSQIEYLQLKFPMLKRTLDREPWAADEASLNALQNACLRVPGVEHIMVFSGDVHYAFARRFQPLKEGPVFWQLCSSASNNAPVGADVGLRLIEKLGRCLSDQQIRYLLPDGERYFLTSDKNIGTLALDDQGQPLESRLLCAGDSGWYEKRYDLADYRETPDNR